MKSWRQKGLEAQQKQKWLDEIHMRPDVKKVFILNEIFATIDSFIAMAIVAVLLYGLTSQDYTGMMNILNILDFDNLTMMLAENLAGFIGIAVFVVVNVVVHKFRKKYTAELEILEEVALREIQKAVEEGTYVPGPTVSLGYRIFRGVRTCIAVFVFLPFMLYSFISFFL